MAGTDLDFFKQFLYEAPDDDPPPDISDDGGVSDDPPDLPDEGGADNNAPPDIEDSDDGLDDPPDIDGVDDFTGEYGDDSSTEDLGLDEKISAIMNMNLYQRFLELLGNVNSQVTQIKDNSDVIYSITPDSTDILDGLTKLNDNIRLYLKHYFVNEDYSKNLLFYNKCLNLLALLNDAFDNAVKKGIKSADV